MNTLSVLSVLMVSAACAAAPLDAPYPRSEVLTGITFDSSTLQRAAKGSDIWASTWAADGHLYSAWGDGGGFGGTDQKGRVSLGVARIDGTPPAWQGINVWGGVGPASPQPAATGKATLIAANRALYLFVSEQGAWDQCRLWKSEDNSRTWTDRGLIFPRSHKAFAFPGLVQFGQDNRESPGGYVYGFSDNDTRRLHDRRLYLFRVKAEQIEELAAYEYFAGTARAPRWSHTIEEMTPVFSNPAGISWGTTCVYHSPTKRYLLAVGIHEKRGDWGLYESLHPWGPWHTVAYGDELPEWTRSPAEKQRPADLHTFPANWMSADGKTLWCIFDRGDHFNLARCTISGPAASADLPGLPPAATEHWTADNGNGTYSNPLFYEEFEDPDILRVGDDYYLAGTTMHMNPAVQIMHSKDLVNWELAGYCMDRLDLGPAFRLEGGSVYGRGIWAPCLRHHEGTFYLFSNVNGVGLQVFRSQSIKGPWERNQLPGRHDLSVLFDDDGKVYIISGGSSPYPIEELTSDLRSFKTDAPKRALVGRMGEGHHLYKINGKYVDVSAIPGGPVDQMVAVADSIDGPWMVERMVQGESLGVTAATPARAPANDRGLWIHQGGIVDTPSGEWWSIIMSDHGSAGRMVALVPVTWDDGFPLIGLPGNLRKAPNTWLKPDTGHTQEPRPAFLHDDSFDGPTLNPHAQWNHVPDDSKWSLTEKPGMLRLHALPARDFYSARNSLCHRPPGPESVMTVELDTTGLEVGDTAGLALLSWPYAGIGVVKTAEGNALHRFTGGGSRRRGPGADAPAPTNAPIVSPTAPPARLWLRVHCNFDTDEALFSWSADGRQFTPLGTPFTMTFQLTTFQGVRPALFNFNTTDQPGGYADFDNYTVVEPRARGLERAIPTGKTITLRSGADGTYLAADMPRHTLVNASPEAAGTPPANAPFHVVDLGRGRVALRAPSGRFVSATREAVVLKDLGGEPPGLAESFQWINLMRGDTMLLSLTNHRYLATQPNVRGPVTVTATGPSPARKGGACFRWKLVD